MKLSEVAPHINPDGDSEVCHDVAPMPWKIGLIVLCDRKPNHTGKHRHNTPKGRMEWWTPAAALEASHLIPEEET